jgi:hypothetical protein
MNPAKELHASTQNKITQTHAIFCLRDIEADGYGLPQPAINAAMFIRELEAVFKNPDHPITKYPSKFEIFEIGSYDYRTGAVTPKDHRALGLVADFAPKLSPPEPTINRI